MDDVDTVSNETAAAVVSSIDDENVETCENSSVCVENSENKDVQDKTVEIEDSDNVIVVEDDDMEESLSKEKENNDTKLEAGEQIEVAVVTCEKSEENDANSSLEVFFDLDNEDVVDSTNLELQVEVTNETSEILNDEKDQSMEDEHEVVLENEENQTIHEDDNMSTIVLHDESVQPEEKQIEDEINNEIHEVLDDEKNETKAEETQNEEAEVDEVVQPMEEDADMTSVEKAQPMEEDKDIAAENKEEVQENVANEEADVTMNGSKDEEMDVSTKQEETNVTTNGDVNAAEEATETTNNDEIKAEPEPVVSTSTLTSDDVVLVSDDEEVAKDKADTTTTTATEKATPPAVSTEQENANTEKISAVAEILDESNTSDSSNLLEISTVQEEREKERLQEKTEEDEEEEDEEVDVEEEEEDEAEKANENEIEVVESNLDIDIICTPPAKRKKLSNEEEEKEEPSLVDTNEQENVECNDKDKNGIEEVETNAEIEQATVNNSVIEEVSSNAENKEDQAQDVEMSETIESVATSNEDKVDMCYPAPNLKKAKESLPLEFLRKFKTNFEKMNRSELEELVLQKIVEAIIYKSEFAEVSKLLQKQEVVSERNRVKITELAKQLKDLNKIHNTVVSDLQKHYTQTVLPLKITRAVGLQVSIPKLPVGAMKKDQPASITTATTTISNENKPNSQLATVAQKAATQVEKSNVSTCLPSRAVQPLSQIQQQQTNKQFFDATKPSTSQAAKEGSLQIRKIQMNT